MAKTKATKGEMYQEYKDLLSNYQTVVMLDTNSLKTHAIESFKSKISKDNSKYVLVKNTLFSKALGELKSELSIDPLEGSTSVLFSKDDPSVILKQLMAFIEENKNILIKMGIIDNALYTNDMVETIAKLPTKPELIAKTVGTIKAPLSSFVNVLSGVQRNFVFALKAIEEKKK